MRSHCDLRTLLQGGALKRRDEELGAAARLSDIDPGQPCTGNHTAKHITICSHLIAFDHRCTHMGCQSCNH